MPARVAELPDCVLFSGVADAGSTPQFLSAGEPRMTLVHFIDSAGAAARETPRVVSLLITPPAVSVPVAQTGSFVAVSAPLARLTRTPLAPLTTLRQTPLVRASSHMLLSVLDDMSQRELVEPHDIDEVLFSLLRGIIRENPAVTAPGATEIPIAERLAALIEARHGDPRLDVDGVARELHVSRRHLYRHVTGDDGVATILAKRRVETARDLLSRFPRAPLSEIAHRSGYVGAGLLRIHFLRYVGMTPTQFRHQAREAGRRPASD